VDVTSTTAYQEERLRVLSLDVWRLSQRRCWSIFAFAADQGDFKRSFLHTYHRNSKIGINGPSMFYDRVASNHW
jgi:hypothetical protein